MRDVRSCDTVKVQHINKVTREAHDTFRGFGKHSTWDHFRTIPTINLEVQPRSSTLTKPWLYIWRLECALTSTERTHFDLSTDAGLAP